MLNSQNGLCVPLAARLGATCSLCSWGSLPGGSSRKCQSTVKFKHLGPEAGPGATLQRCRVPATSVPGCARGACICVFPVEAPALSTLLPLFSGLTWTGLWTAACWHLSWSEGPGPEGAGSRGAKKTGGERLGFWGRGGETFSIFLLPVMV